MLSHVRVEPSRSLYDAWRLVRLMGPAFEPYRGRQLSAPGPAEIPRRKA
jgi:hypothetical protein